jgi:hypothetical protein
MKSLARLATPGLLSLFCLAAYPACVVNSSQSGDDEKLAEDASALTTSSSQSTGLSQVVLSPIEADDVKTSEAAAEAVEKKPITGLSPEGCVTKTRTGAKVHTEFNGCTGPFGLVSIKGGIDVTFSSSAAGSLHAEFESTEGLTIQNRPVEYSATADFSINGTERNLTWEGSWTSENVAGAPITYTSEGDLTVDLATSCVTFSGEASGSVAGRGLTITIDDLKGCPTECPSGKITATGEATGASVSLSFDGSNKAAVTGPRGGTFTVQLFCSDK